MSQLDRWPSFIRPTLQILSDGQTWRTSRLFAAVADATDLTDAQRAETIKTGQPRAYDRITWALYHLRRAGAVRSVRNGYSVITDTGRRLLSTHPEAITLDVLAALPDYQTYQPKSRRPATTEAVDEGPAYWFVGAFYDNNDDHAAEFVERGIWRNGYTDRYADIVNSMQAGERIAIKAAYTRKYELPFDNKGNRVSVLAIKATGTITRNHGDGQTVDVDWDQQEPIREWYFFTNQRTVWRVLKGDWKTDALVAFTFEGEDQDIDEFCNADFWRERFGDDVPPSGDPAGYLDDDDDDDPTPDVESYSLDDVAKEGCFISEATLADYLGALESKKNLILQGPPGTGKTWLAKRLGFALIGEKSRKYLRAIQFHPSTSYEDFVRGWRPSADGRLILADGIFLEVVVEAHANPGNKYVVVIEEINRGNLAQIFGELLTLLESEKRTPSEAIELTYRRPEEPPLHLPENLYIIGTMNLADRSLAIVDYALRRRFGFAELRPQFNDKWRMWVHEHNGVGLEFLDSVARRVAAVNDTIASDPSLGEQYQIGHSFFVPPPTRKIIDSAAWVRQVVSREIRPLLNEYWFDEPERVASIGASLLGEVP